MIWTFLLALTGILAGWFNPLLRRREQGLKWHQKIKLKWYGWLFIFAISVFTMLSLIGTHNAEKRAENVRKATLKMVVNDIESRKWKAVKVTEIEKLIDITRERNFASKVFLDIDSTKDIKLQRLTFYKDDFQMAYNSISDLIYKWRISGFSDKNLVPLTQLTQCFNLDIQQIDKLITDFDNKPVVEKTLEIYKERLRDLPEVLRVRANVALEYRYSEMVSGIISNKSE